LGFKILNEIILHKKNAPPNFKGSCFRAVTENMLWAKKNFNGKTKFNYWLMKKSGSGNTKNIGSVVKIEELINGKGPFSNLGEDIFDDYWMYYLTKDMAKAVDLKLAPYKNLSEYFEYKKIKR